MENFKRRTLKFHGPRIYKFQISWIFFLGLGGNIVKVEKSRSLCSKQINKSKRFFFCKKLAGARDCPREVIALNLFFLIIFDWMPSREINRRKEVIKLQLFLFGLPVLI